MGKIAVLMLILIAFALIFGCFGPGPTSGPDGNTLKITNDGDASKTLNDVSTNLSGVKQTLDDAENTLTK